MAASIRSLLEQRWERNVPQGAQFEQGREGNGREREESGRVKTTKGTKDRDLGQCNIRQQPASAAHVEHRQILEQCQACIVRAAPSAECKREHENVQKEKKMKETS
jgi:hypothetical protein